jgi:hypothetical protein
LELLLDAVDAIVLATTFDAALGHKTDAAVFVTHLPTVVALN